MLGKGGWLKINKVGGTRRYNLSSLDQKGKAAMLLINFKGG